MVKKLLLSFFILSLGLYNPLLAQVVNSESFDESYFPANWWSLSGSNSSYLFTTSSGSNPTQTPNSGSGQVEFNSYALTSGGTEDLISPVIDWSGRGASTPSVSFYFYRDRTAYNTAGYNAEGVNVYVNTSASLTGATFLGFVPRRGSEAPTAATGWHQYSYNIPAGYNGCTNFIIFDFVSAFGDNCFLDDVSYTSYPTAACNCTAPTSQPSSLVLSNITSSSISGSFTASSPSADGYLVVQTTSSTAPTNPVNGTNYLVGTSALGGTIVASGTATTFTATGLSSNTQYWYWIYAMNNSLCPPSYRTTSPLSGNGTTLSGKNWIGAGAGGAGTDFNTATNWSPTGVPGATEEAIITTTTAAVITLSANATIGALTITNNATTGITLALDVQNRSLLINNQLNASINVSGGFSTVLSLRVGNSGSITVGGDAYLGVSANTSSYIEFVGSGSTSTTGTVTFKKDVVFGQTYYPTSTTNSIGTFIWDGTGTQTIYTNNSYNPYLNGSSQIGNTNTPNVILSDTYLGNLQTYISGKNLTVNAGATLDLTTNTWNASNASGTFTNSGILKLAGTTGGQTGSNFPSNYSTNTLATTSTVEYYGTSAQTVFAGATYGNLTLTNNAVKTAGAALTVNGATTINSSATFAASTFTHNLKGNFINNGTFTSNTSTTIFSGTSAQTVSGSSTTTFYKLTINNTSTGVTLSSPINVSNALALTTGLLNTDATNIITMQNGSTAPALTSAATSYVNGPMDYQLQSTTKTNLNFPIGTSPDCRPFILTIQHTTAATLYNYTARLYNANPWVAMASTYTDMPSTVDTISGVHYWTINRTDASGTSQPSASLSGNQQIQLYFGTNDGVYQGSGLTIVKNTSATPATWIDIGGTSALGNFSSGQAGSVTSTSSPSAFTSFSSFTLGSKNTGWDPLPIELLSFTAVANGDKVDIKWETITETNNAYFTVEKSKDGVNFTKLIDVPGAGNSNSYRDYAETDYQPYEGTSYYRLKQTDNNGKFTYFNMVPVTFVKEGQQSIVLFPNPMTENTTNLNVNVTGYKGQEVVVVLRDVQGKEFLSKILLSEDDNHVFIVEGTTSLPAGAYIVTASSNNKIYNYKIIVK